MLEAEFQCVWLSEMLVFIISLDEIVRLGWICSVYWGTEGGESFFCEVGFLTKLH